MEINDFGDGKFIVDIQSSDELFAFISSTDRLEKLAEKIHSELKKYYYADCEVYFYRNDDFFIACFDDYPTYYSDYAFMHYKLPVHMAIEYLYELIPKKMIKLNKLGAFSRHDCIDRGFIKK